MDNIFKLKIQLEEAVRFANSTTMGHDRMGVILMDNFIEIQLVRQMQFKFQIEFLNDYKNLKYPFEKRQQILFNHDKLLKVCHEENMINSHERRILAFCHEVRNRLYHKGDDDSLLIKTALHSLHEIITKHQPDWKGGTDIIRVPFDFETGKPIDMEHPFTKKRKKELGSQAYETGSKEDWIDFVKLNFDLVNKEESPSKLLSDFLIMGVKRLRSAMKYAIDGNKKKLGFDELSLLYSFKVKKQDQLQQLAEMPNKKEAKIMHEELYKEYKQFYKPILQNRINSFENIAKKIATLPSGEALEKYLSIRTDFFLLHDSFIWAAQETQQEIFAEVDKHIKRSKIKKK